MSTELPEGSYWEWVKYVPPGWDIPSDLRRPTKTSIINLIIQMLASDTIDYGMVQILGTLLTEIARFNAWYAQEVDGKVSPKEQAALYTVYRDITKTIFDAWKDYVATPGDSPELVEAAYHHLDETCRHVVHQLMVARDG